MPKNHVQGPELDVAATYRITVQGNLSPRWSDRLDDMVITTAAGRDSRVTTTLVGPLIDQAALAGVLNTLYELGLTLLSVEQLSED